MHARSHSTAPSLTRAIIQVVGRKRVTLFHPDDFRSLYPVRTVSDNPHSSRAHIEQWREDADGEYRKLYPSLGEVRAAAAAAAAAARKSSPCTCLGECERADQSSLRRRSRGTKQCSSPARCCTSRPSGGTTSNHSSTASRCCCHSISTPPSPSIRARSDRRERDGYCAFRTRSEKSSVLVRHEPSLAPSDPRPFRLLSQANRFLPLTAHSPPPLPAATTSSRLPKWPAAPLLPRWRSS